MKALVLYTLPPPEMGERAAEFDISEAAYGVADVLGVTPVGVLGALDEVLAVLAAHRPDVVFNLLEAPLGRPDLDGSLAALLEWRGTPFTGNGSGTLALCRRKDHTHAVLAAAGVPVPRSGADAGFPCFVKPAGEDGSAGIDAASICHDTAARDAAVARIAAAGLGAAVIEAYLPGRELNVALWSAGFESLTGNPSRRPLAASGAGRAPTSVTGLRPAPSAGTRPPLDVAGGCASAGSVREFRSGSGGTHAAVGEIAFEPGIDVLTWASKWDPASAEYQRSPSVYPADIPPELRAATVAVARAAARAVGARGYLRVDLRLDAAGAPHVIDVNPNPDVTPGAGLARGIASAGWSWDQFVHAQVAAALAARPGQEPPW